MLCYIMLLHATNYGTGCSFQWAYATSYRAASTVLPELDGFHVARMVSWVFMHGQHNCQVRHPSYGQLHACPWGVGHVVIGVPTPFMHSKSHVIDYVHNTYPGEQPYALASCTRSAAEHHDGQATHVM